PADAHGVEAAHAIDDAVRDPEVDLVIIAAAGSAALAPTLAALEAGKDIALATKEVLVMAGELVRERMRRHGSQIFPIDSEHSAIWQCLWGEKEVGVRRLILTGSGGPFLRRPVETLESVTVAEALAHPRWKMGPKISVGPATRPRGPRPALLRGSRRGALPGRGTGAGSGGARGHRPRRAQRRQRGSRGALPPGPAPLRRHRSLGRSRARGGRTGGRIDAG